LDSEKFASVLDLFVGLAGERRYVAMAMGVCNGLAAKFKCDRVSLGWLKGGFIQLQAISRTEAFDRQMAAAKALAVAMEEALDQDDEILWPAPQGSSTVTRDHEKFAREQGAGNVCSLPLRVDGTPSGVITCERQAPEFSLTELQQIRLTCDMAAPRLAELRNHDRWFGARWAAQLRTQSARLIGPEHTWAKLLALLIMVLLVLLVFLRLPYRVQGNFILRSGQAAYLSAPFDGYIDQVFVRPGDPVKAGQPLLQLKTTELELEEAYALADLDRFQRDAEKARAATSLADMRISEAMAEQAKARLDLARFRRKTATIRAEFPGIVIEGDLRERLGSPVKAGDVLLQVARIDTLYAEAEVDERDVHEILDKSSGQIAFLSRPKIKFPIHIITVEPAAVPKNEANLFLVRCGFDTAPQTWWRPGMSGVCKINVGKRALLWILSHRTIDFLRLKLWW
jgi:multidrug resistance efflux pump